MSVSVDKNTVRMYRSAPPKRWETESCLPMGETPGADKPTRRGQRATVQSTFKMDDPD
jgi:hypothetical protein